MKKSTSGNVFLFDGMIVSWLSKIQVCVATHAMEAEYISCNTIVSNVAWIKRFFDNLKLGILDRALDVLSENIFAISLIESEANSSKGKHIDVDYHYLQAIVKRGKIWV